MAWYTSAEASGWLAGIIAVVGSVIGYRLSENDRRTLGRTPWGLPSLLWALFWFLSLLLGLVLYLIAHSNEVRRAQHGSPAAYPGAGGATVSGAAAAPTLSVADQFPAYPRPANIQPERAEPEPAAEVEGGQTVPAERTGQAAPAAASAPTPGVPTGMDTLAACLAPRSEREVPLPLVGRPRMDLTGLDRRPPPDRHQFRSAHRSLPLKSAVPVMTASVGTVSVRTESVGTAPEGVRLEIRGRGQAGEPSSTRSRRVPDRARQALDRGAPREGWE